MDALPRTLYYSPQGPVPLLLFDLIPRQEFELWQYIEQTFMSLSGLSVVSKEERLSYSLILGDTDWVFRYGGSLKDMRIEKHGSDHFIDVAATLNLLLVRLNRKMVAVEADKTHFKISAILNEKE